MTEATLTGVQRAAVLLLSLGELDAAEVLRHMEPKEVQKIGIAMATMTDITREQVERVMDQFGQELGSKTSLGVGSDDYIRNMLVQALGSEGRQPDRPHPAGPQHHRPGRAEVDGPARGGRPGAQRASADHRHRDGAPETDQAADALKLLPDRTRVDVLLRIATLDGIPPNALNELNEIMERQFAGNQNLKSSNIGGVQCAANILNFMDSGQDQAILGEIARIDAPLSNRIQDLMFVFDDLVDLDDREMQLVLREVSGERLGLALRGADIKVRDKITRNMSQRAAEILLEDMEARGPVRLSDVEGAQREILAIVKRMADEGTVTIGGSAEAML